MSNSDIYATIGGDDWSTTAVAISSSIIIPDIKYLERYKNLLTTVAWRYAMNAIMVRYYTKLDRYKDSPKQLVADIRGIDSAQFKGVITADIYLTHLCFFIENPCDYDLLGVEGSAGFAGGKNLLEELTNCVVYIKGAEETTIYGETLKHEGQHIENKILHTSRIKNYVNDTERLAFMLERGKDEILAFMTNKNETSENIYRYLTENTGKINTPNHYNYIQWLPTPAIDQSALVTAYKVKLQELIDIAFACADEKVPNYLNLLALIPAKKWGLIRATFLNSKWHIKYERNRTIPWYFGNSFASLKNESDVLKLMYQICPEYVVRPIYDDPDLYFYISERFCFTKIDSIKLIPDPIFSQIQKIITLFHQNGIAHGDLLGNILFRANEQGVVIEFKIIDPIGISFHINGGFFGKAKQADLRSLAKIAERKLELLKNQTPVFGGL